MSARARVALSGLPGRMAAAAAKAIAAAEDLELLPFGLTGPGMGGVARVGAVEVRLYEPGQREDFLAAARAGGPFIAVDYTLPGAVAENARFYAAYRVPFVMGTTGGDREELIAIASRAQLPAVIAPNMALPIVALTAMLEHGAGAYPGMLSGFRLKVRESHQRGKADTSGTARALIELFRRMGASFDESDLAMCRDPEEQRREWDIPKEHLGGHAYHTYELSGYEGALTLSFAHNVLGRAAYAAGTVHAVRFLTARRLERPETPYTMMDVLRHLKG